MRRESVRGRGEQGLFNLRRQTEDVSGSSCVFLLPNRTERMRACHANAPRHCCKLPQPIAANPNKVKDHDLHKWYNDLTYKGGQGYKLPTRVTKVNLATIGRSRASRFF